jgi:hypothetical protein
MTHLTHLGRRAGVTALALLLAAMAAQAQKVTFKDPAEDDDGPGKYVYPTDPVYKPGSFDLTGFELKEKGDRVEVRVDVAAKLTDVWNTGSGFSLQTVFIFVQTADRRVKKTESKATQRAKAEEAKTAVGGAAPGGAATGEKPSGAAAGGAASTGEKPAGAAAGGAAAAGEKPAGAAAGEAESTGEKPAGATAAGEKPAAGAAGEKTSAAGSGKGGAAKAAPQGPKPPPGITVGLPGLDVQFGAEDAWDRCIILSPAPAAQVRAAVEALAPGLKDAIIVPDKVEGSGHTITATFERKALGVGGPKGGPPDNPKNDPRKWGFQVVMAGYDPYPATGDLLVRRVDEVEGQHRFGGGTDGNCSPNVLDVLAPDGEGDQDEVQEQHEMLQYECNPDNSVKKLASLQMVRMPDPEEEKRQEKEERRKKRQEQNAAPADKPSPAAPPPATNGPGGPGGG